MPRRRKDPSVKQKEFITAATAIFFSKGYEATSIQDILKAVGGDNVLSPSVFYYYFSSKDQLFEAVIKNYIAEYMESVIKIIESPIYNYSDKMQLAFNEVLKATQDFLQIDSYFDQGTLETELFNFYIDKHVRSMLQQPLSILLTNALGDIPHTPLLDAAGVPMLVEIMLWAIYPLSHQVKEADGKHHNEKHLSLMPLIFSQILGMPIETLIRRDEDGGNL